LLETIPMNATTTNPNGRTRKSLAEQIDRLDEILDGLAENLNAAVVDAVAGAVKEAVTVAVQEAVHAAVLEVLTNAELRKRLGVTQVPASRPSAPVIVVLANTMRRCWSWLTGAYDTAKTVAKKAASKATEAVQRCLATGRRKLQEVREQVAVKARTGWMLAVALAALAKRFRKQLLVALAVGVLVGVVCYLGGREVASLGCALAGFTASLATGVVNRLRRLLPLLVGGGS
jgi:hypothetical protein